MSAKEKKAAKNARQRAEKEAKATAPQIAPSGGMAPIKEAGDSNGVVTCSRCVDGEEFNWPQVKCETCDHKDKWSRMKRWYELDGPVQQSISDPVEKSIWHYICLCCKAKEWGMDLISAKARMVDEDPMTQDSCG